MNRHDLVSRISELAGIDSGAAERALRATISTLVEALASDEADALGRELPSDLRSLIHGHAMAMPLDREALVANVAVREATELGFATEHAACACRALSEQLSPELRARLVRHLPRLAPLLDAGASDI